MDARIVNITGKYARVLPYSEKRRKALLEIATEIEGYINKNESDRIDPAKRAEFWKRKAELLFEFIEEKPPIEFYLSDEFELGILVWAEQDFIRQRLYL